MDKDSLDKDSLDKDSLDKDSLDKDSTKRHSDIRENTEKVSNWSWEIHYNDAQCKFETPSSEEAVIYDLKVPDKKQNEGIGTAMVETAEQIIREQTDVKFINAQIGASNGSTKHVLQNKCGFEIIDEYYKEELGEIVDATKQLE
jgi:GNAT superfamily N-acetyltransferase